jgi:hypothetical protein
LGDAQINPAGKTDQRFCVQFAPSFVLALASRQDGDGLDPGEQRVGGDRLI